jgi:hypothetical protein
MLWTETDSRLAGQEIPPFLWNPKIHDRVHKGSALNNNKNIINNKLTT